MHLAQAYTLALLLQRQGAPPPGMLPAAPQPHPAAHVPEPDEPAAPLLEAQLHGDLAGHAHADAAAADQIEAPLPPPAAAHPVLLGELDDAPADGRLEDTRARFAAAPGVFMLSALEMVLPGAAPVRGSAALAALAHASCLDSAMDFTVTAGHNHAPYPACHVHVQMCVTFKNILGCITFI